MRVEFQEITKHYQTKAGLVRAVDQLSWNGNSGRVCGFLGPNGSGKTTAVRLLLDLLRPDSGEIIIDGKEWGNRDKEFRTGVGYLPEERGLYKRAKALDLLVYLGQLKGLSRSEAKLRAQSCLSRFGLADYASAPIDSFSKGMGQKVQLIMALIHRPSLAILDEPFSGLDPLNVRFVREVISELRAEGAMVILCTHRMDEAERLCDDILMLRKGKIALSGPQRALREACEGRRIRVAAGFPIERLTSVEKGEQQGEYQDVVLHADASLRDFFSELAREHIQLKELHITPVSLEELYIRATKEA